MVTFQETIKIIEIFYTYSPTRFSNGCDNDLVTNESGDNEGSCKIFSFALLHNLSKDQTLSCFGDYYRVDVLQHANGNNHANIRTFIKHGWEHLQFSGHALAALQ